ncbi:MAG TPA: hypothetical protein VEV83_20790 [Parafilimonas sp.]|nr:hypothetical protein [Parafilimonas sp.]
MNEQQIEIRLWNYIDGELSAEEKHEIEQKLNNDSKWRQTYDQLLELNESIHSDLKLEDPPMRFSSNVMEQLSKMQVAPGAKTYINKKIITALASFFVLLIGGLLIYVTTQVNWATATTEKFGFDLRTVDITRHLNSQVINVLLSMLVVLMLMLVERYVSTNLAKLKRNQVSR